MMTETTEPSAARSRVLTAVPTFMVDDVGVTARWYVKELGFSLAGSFPAEEPLAYASLQHGGAEIMLLRLPGYQKPQLASLRAAGVWDAYLRTRGVATLYRALQGREFIHSALQRRPYGDWEFEVRDPNGYVLVFGGEGEEEEDSG
jgi:uncharacterized glyoxalase superfamily protein PhnB